MKEPETTVLERAITLAMKAYKGMERKKEGKPYILHPMEVAVIASDLVKNDEDLLAAALLHDAVEDTDVTLKEIKETCGKKVAALVEAETEEKRHGTPSEETWKVRKQESLDRLRDCDSAEIKALWLADKLSNVRSFYRMWKGIGNEFWKDFNQKDSVQQAWYYRTVALLTQDFSETDAWQEYNRIVETIFGKQQPVEGRMDHETLILSLAGKIDSANSNEIMSEIEKIREKYPANEIVLD